MKITDQGNKVLIQADDINFKEYLIYLDRNPNEILHHIKDRTISKVAMLNHEPVIFQVQQDSNGLAVSFPRIVPSVEARNATALYTVEWLDLDRNLEPFYDMARTDPILQHVVERFKGHRLVGVPDLFEALCWAIMGQQVSLHVAYLLKKRFVETFGQSVAFEGTLYWLFPTFEHIAKLTVHDLTSLKFTQKKAEYIIGIAQRMAYGQLSKESLLQRGNIGEMEKYLTEIRGIGNWTANYVMMRCLRQQDAFPLADAGLHNALKRILHLEKKPGLDEINAWSGNWSGWKAYATFYLWRSLL
ncbi:DNA-3-methyladenine glycosylase family protein [Bacillus sp. T33-2]|uniref:DNA-3-methyladenine glycosylase family protein n=1 Tax=Bacillus sp. T33-2 TaxID=2054168 RepID=UPI000C793634|nr:DNA-3-methyladenine glycosylase 2 [Bacillus sp. T33-2]PLR95270.1 DNA-3-methyladenine glycosylase [Bacillus sp. T33-2]